jgi:hypothetical protein
MNSPGDCRRTLRTVPLFTLLLAPLVAVPALGAEDLEKQMLRQAPQILDKLRENGYRNVGVLKFRVKKGNEPLTDNAGPLNLTLANRLEMALVLANKVKSPLGIIHDASAVAARLPGASHLTAEGRAKLFGADYPLAWGTEKVKADALLTGIALISPDLRDMNVGILAFDKDGKGLQKVAQFTAPVDAVALIESGESFLLRGAFDQEPEQTTPAAQPAKPLTPAAAVQTAARVREQQQDYPLADQVAPIELEVRYDGRKVPLEIVGGKARIPEPQEGQEVTLVLSRRIDNKERYAVVLKVNGENTLYKQRLRDVDCRKWVLDPGDGPITIRGFQKDGQTAEKFRVLSREESKAREVYYGADVGTISISVFREKKGKDKPVPVLTLKEADEAEDLAALTRGVFPEETSQNLAALQVQLRSQETRGLIGEGDKIGSEVQRVKFIPDPVAVMSATITYYKP